MININRLNQNNEYSIGKPNIEVKRSKLLMREATQTSGQVGKIIPFFWHEMLPSEKIDLKHSLQAQFTPFITNVVHEMYGEINTYFVPYRIIWEDWEKFITGCDEERDLTDGTLEIELPKFKNSDIYKLIVALWREKTLTANTHEEALTEIGVGIENEILALSPTQDSGQLTILREAISKIVTKIVQSAGTYPFDIIVPTTIKPSGWNGTQKEWSIGLNKGFTKWLRETLVDYAGLPITYNIINSLEKETTPSSIVYYDFNSGTSGVQKTRAEWITIQANDDNNQKMGLEIIKLNFLAYNKIYNDWIRLMDWEPRRNKEDLRLATGNYSWDIFTRARKYQLRGAMPKVPINIDEITIATGNANGTQSTDLDITNLTKSYQIRSKNGTTVTGNVNVQKTIEPEGSWNILDMVTPAGILNYYMSNARIKPRYSEQLLARWGVDIQDSRFQYAQIVASQKMVITQNGVTQTAPQVGDSTLQGNITGQAWGQSNGSVSFYAPEHGILISLLTIKPSNMYELGIESKWLKKTKFDYPTPELVDTPDTQIFATELAPFAPENQVFGYKGIYDEYRTKVNRVTGILRPSIQASLGAKTLARNWTDKITMEDVIKCHPPMERVKQFVNQPDFILVTDTAISTKIPLPYINDPRIMI